MSIYALYQGNVRVLLKKTTINNEI